MPHLGQRHTGQLTDGCEEEPSLVDGGAPLLVIVVDGDLGGGTLGQREGQRSLVIAGKPGVTTPPVHSLSSAPVFQESLLGCWAASPR